MRDSRGGSFWSTGSNNFSSNERYERYGPYRGDDNRGYGEEGRGGGGGYPGENRSFPPPPPQTSSGNYGYNSPPHQRYGGSSGGMNQMGGPMGGGPGGGMGRGIGMGSGPDGGMGMPGPASMGPGGGPMQGMGGPPGDMPTSFGGSNRNESNFVDSLRKISQMGSNSSDLEIASKIINAVLSTNVGRQHEPPRSRSPPQYREREPSRMRRMSPYEERKGFASRRPPPPRRSSVDRYSRGRREFRRSPPPRSRMDRPDLRKRLAYRLRDESRSKDWPSRKRPRRDSDSKEEERERKAKPKKEEKDPHQSSSESVDKPKDEEDFSGDEDEDSSKRKKIVLAFDKDKEERKEKREFPSGGLFCHMCNHGGFASEKTYLYHLEGVRHRKTAIAFHAKNESTLEYLRKNAKLASIRVGGLDNHVKPAKCTVCHAIVKESFFKHKKLLEHRLVKKFLMPKCCGRFFKSHHDMDEHRLSLPHLRKVLHSNETKEELMEKSASNEMADEILQVLAGSPNNDPTEALHFDNMPPFDGNKMIGLSFLKPQQSLLCEACHTLLPASAKGIEGHLVSINHYNNLIEHLRALRRKEREERKENDMKEKEDGDKDNEHSDNESDDERVKIGSDDEADLPFLDETHIVLDDAEAEEELEELKVVGEDEAVEDISASFVLDETEVEFKLSKEGAEKEEELDEDAAIPYEDLANDEV